MLNVNVTEIYKIFSEAQETSPKKTFLFLVLCPPEEKGSQGHKINLAPQLNSLLNRRLLYSWGYWRKENKGEGSKEVKLYIVIGDSFTLATFLARGKLCLTDL